MLSKQGIISVSPSGGVALMSQDILSTIQKQINQPHLKEATHAVFDPTEHEYIIWLPIDVPSATTGVAEVFPGLNFAGYRLNLRTKTWAKVTKSATASYVKNFDKLLYCALTPTDTDLSTPTPPFGQDDGWESQVVIERRLFDNTDYQDETGAAITYKVQWVPFTGSGVHNEKQFTESTMLLNSTSGLSAATMGYMTDSINSESTVAFSTTDPEFVATSANSREVRTLVPDICQQGRYLIASFTHAVAQEDWEIETISIRYNDEGGRGSKN